MKEEIKVPPLGESISEATIAAILKPAGSAVKMDEELIELATDKVNQVLYAPQAGVFNPTVKEDDVVKIGQVIGIIEVKAGVSAEEKQAPPPKVETAKEEAASAFQKKAEVQAPAPAQTVAKEMPKVENQKGARVSVDDYLQELSQPPAKVSEKLMPAEPASVKPSEGGGPRETRQKMTKIRKIIAQRLVDVQRETAMLTTFNEVDLTEVMLLREKYKEYFSKKYGVRLGLMSFFVKASISALKAFPAINSYIDGEDLVQRHYFNIGIAVGGEKGLVVPVLKNCDSYSFGEIEAKIVKFAEQIKEGKLSADDLYGGGFTITNGGVYGSLLSTPIISPKQCAILGMHKISKRPMVVDDQIAIRQMMYLALSYDHRIIDGKEAVSFLVHIKNCLEDPRRMLIEM